MVKKSENHLDGFKCNYCNNIYSSQSSRCNHIKKYHTNNNIKCLPNVSQMLAKCLPNVSQMLAENLLKCNFCDKTYKHRSSKSKHEKKCKMKIENKNILMLEEIKELKNLLVTNININNGNIDNSKKIIINNFGNENTDYLTFDFFKEALLHLKFD